MSNKKTKYTENNLQISRKRSLSINSLDAVNKKRSGSTSKRHRPLLTCVVCDADAHGYNFDAISCESCKAFFRRNASRPLERLKCRGLGQCNVSFNMKRRCKKCRLEKCFKSGMRKEWILSEKEKEEKRIKIEENRRLKQIHDNNQESHQFTKRDSKTDDDLSLDLSPLFNQILTDYDWFNIQSIKTWYIEAVKLNQIAGISPYPSIQSIESTLELFRVPLYISSMRLISYIKQLDEFQSLHEDDQVYFNGYHEQDTIDPVFSGKDWIKTLNKQFHLEMKNLRNDFIDIFQSDDIIIKLFYIILIFSNQMSLNQSSHCSYQLINTLDIFKAQNVFTDLVYRYCLQQYKTHKTPVLFLRYITKIMKIQLLIDQIKHTIHNYIDATKLSPLMQSLLV